MRFTEDIKKRSLSNKKQPNILSRQFLKFIKGGDWVLLLELKLL